MKRETQREEKGADVRFPPPLLYVVLVVVSAGLERVVRLPLPFPEPARQIVGAGLGLLALFLIFASVRRFLSTGQSLEPWKATPEIITAGPYRWTRNPMYLGMTLIQCWVALAYGSGWLLLFVPVAMAAIQRLVIAPEEAYLTRRFGEAYLRYCRDVPRWL